MWRKWNIGLFSIITNCIDAFIEQNVKLQEEILWKRVYLTAANVFSKFVYIEGIHKLPIIGSTPFAKDFDMNKLFQ